MAVDDDFEVERPEGDDERGEDDDDDDADFFSLVFSGLSPRFFPRSRTSLSNLVFFFWPNLGFEEDETPPLFPVQLGMPEAAGAQRRRDAFGWR